MKIILYILIIAPFASFGQLNCTVKLIDDYSNEEIKVNSGIHLRKAQIEVNSTQNQILLNRLKGSHLIISSSDYETFDTIVKRKHLKNDTLIMRLVPNDSLCALRYDEIWVQHLLASDTVVVDSVVQIQNYVQSNFNYLLANDRNCGNGTCGYSTLFLFWITFTMKSGVYNFSEIEKLRPDDNQCPYLEGQLSQLHQVLPTFRNSNVSYESIGKFMFTVTIIHN